MTQFEELRACILPTQSCDSETEQLSSAAVFLSPKIRSTAAFEP